jgi:sugar phosphate isomerase/epimerase
VRRLLSMDRRRFLSTAASASLTAALSLSTTGIQARSGEWAVGLELITVLALLNEDFRATLMSVAAIGYQQVETLGSLGRSPAEVHAVFADCHLVSPAQHLVPDDLYGVYQRWDRGLLSMADAMRSLSEGYALSRIEPIIEQGIARAHAMDQQFLVWPVLFDDQVASRQSLDALIRAFNVAGGLCRRAGLTFAFHNGSKAFTRIGTDMAYDLILRHTNPETVKMELDTYYAAKAGADPLAYFEGFPDRFRLIHLKDIDGKGEITDLGQGTIDFPAIINAAKRAGIRHFFVEHDQATDPLAGARSSFDYLQRL